MDKAYLPEVIRADRILLKKHKVDMAETMFACVEQDRARLQRFLPWTEFTKTVEDERHYIESTIERWERYELFDYGIFKLENEEFMGNVGVHTINWLNSCCELGYWIAGEFEGQGYMSEAVAALTNASHEFFNRVEIRCDPANRRSAAVPENLGFHFEGHLKKNVYMDGEYRDSLVYSHLQSDGRIESKSRPLPRPACIKHYSEILSPDDSHYPGSEELLSFGAAIGKATGLQRIGVHHEILKPGRRTSWPHAESAEEEFVYVVQGNPSAWINGNLYPLRPGDAVGFPAGTGIAHTFINNTNREAVLLVVGERSKPENRCIYPLHPERNQEIGDFLWQDCPAQELGPHDGMPDLLR